ncbi:MAG: cyclic nucleotide-binding domain-containing protein [Actinomycetota bacterium]
MAETTTDTTATLPAGNYRIEDWVTGDEDLTAIHELRYTVLVDEMDKYHDQACHFTRTLVDEEDARSWHTVALADDGTIAAVNRMTWGGAGFSARQIEQYALQPWLDAGLADHICVGERTMVAPAHRGSTALHELQGDRLPDYFDDVGVRIVFGVCEPHLLGLYHSMGCFPYAERNINSDDAGYLIPIVNFPFGADSVRGLGLDPVHGTDTDADHADGPQGFAAPVAAALAGRSAVLNPAMVSAEAYLAEVQDSLDAIEDNQIGAFDGLASHQIAQFLTKSSIISCAQGDRLLKAGNTGRNLYIVLDGRLDARIDGRTVGTLHAGDVFGETAFLLGVPRTADVHAETPDPRVLCTSAGAIRRMIDDDAAIAAIFLGNLAKMLATRLAASR